jgi:beta-N-acetylhexosaminidase
MTAHVVYPALDPDRPATLSPLILRDLLRRRLAFQGVVASDDLEMRAISDQCDAGEAAVQALAAGVDLVLVCADLAKAELAAAAVERAVSDGELSPGVVTTAAVRILALRRPAPPTPPPAIEDLPIAAHAALRERILSLAGAQIPS